MAKNIGIVWYRLVSVSLTDTLAFDTKYRYRWILKIDTSIGMAEAQTPILTNTCIGIGMAETQTPILVSVLLTKYGIAHLWCLPGK